MPDIFDNLTPDSRLLKAIQTTLGVSNRADFCVGYFNLRGWKHIESQIDGWDGQAQQCRVLVGMQKLPFDQLRESLSLAGNQTVDTASAARLKRQVAEEFKEQLVTGVPTNDDEQALKRLAAQLRAKKVVVKLFLKHPLHAKLYLFHRLDPIIPMVGYLGSSNLTFAGLSGQGELNVDVLDQDACNKLNRWFEDRWNDSFCIDITDELAGIIEESWARTELIPPYHIYLKMAYHMSQEARAGLSEFNIPSDFGDRLFDFQTAAVKIAAHHLHRRNGVLIGDVVGLGKTLMATALARIFEDDFGLETLIICPKNLVSMWDTYRQEYRMRATIVPISQAIGQLPEMRRYRLVIIDESHNLRNREGKRYGAIQDYIRANDSKCILLSATPYNKTYRDMSNQLRLFVDDEEDIGIRPERLIRKMGGEVEFNAVHQSPIRSLSAFDFSEHPDDWRDLMRLYMVRRTRSFIQKNYSAIDPDTGRSYLTYENDKRSYFPERRPVTVPFEINDSCVNDQYARLYSKEVVEKINALKLARYGLGQYVDESKESSWSAVETRQIGNLSRAGKRLMGFCRTNLFKRLESSGASFIQSVERHILRDFVYLHALDNDLPLPIGTQDSTLLDTRFTDTDSILDDPDEDTDEEGQAEETTTDSWTADGFGARAAAVYGEYTDRYHSRFNWLRPSLFHSSLRENLEHDTGQLLSLLQSNGEWNPELDTKLDALQKLLTETYADKKVLVFSQFADTVSYLGEHLKARDLKDIAYATGATNNPTDLVHRFSPVSNEKDASPDDLRVLIATDMLSEGQNLQDCSIVVNYDLPWAIIRLIQRAGRVDRIGQKSKEILCHSFLPADGVERIIQLRCRVQKRLAENAEVVGTDEVFFEGDKPDDGDRVRDLYNERSGILDDEGELDSEVDLASHAYQIWKNAITEDPSLEEYIAKMPNVVFSSRHHAPDERHPEGVLVFVRTGDGNDALAYINAEGESITESQLEILSVAECDPDTPAFEHRDSHHNLVERGVRHLANEARRIGGQLGPRRGARYRVYTRLREHLTDIQGTFFAEPLDRALNDIYRYPLRQTATDSLNRQLQAGVDDATLAELVRTLRDENMLCIIEENAQVAEPRIICSMGLFQETTGDADDD